MDRDKILFQFDIRAKLGGLEFQRERIFPQTIASGIKASPVHDVDFYVIILRRLLRQIEDVAHYDSRVANLKGRHRDLVERIKIRDHFEHGADLENTQPVDVGSLPRGTISAPAGSNIKIVTSLLNNQIVSGGFTWNLDDDHDTFVNLVMEFLNLYPFSEPTQTPNLSRLDVDTFNKFVKEANRAHQQLCLWFSANNEFAKHQARWNKLDQKIEPFVIENFTRKLGCKYKNFWSVTIPTLQHSWILSTARLFDPAYHPRDKKKTKPRISLDYVLINLIDQNLSNSIRQQITSHEPVIKSLRGHRDKSLAHNDSNFVPTRIEAGVENLFQWLENAITSMKKSEPHLGSCGNVNIAYNEKLSQCGVDEIFEDLLLAEKTPLDQDT